jgi:serine/threonine protein kinase
MRSCCPCFLVAIAGPWITVLGAVFVQKVIVQHLAGPLYLSPELLHPSSTTNDVLRLFYALRRSLRELRGHYSHLPRQLTNARLFPYAQSYADLTAGITMNLDYVTLLSDESRAVYLAKVDGTDVVVKFASTYCVDAHNLLAKNNLAPNIIYDGTKGPFYGGLSMIVMEYVKSETLTQFLQSSPSQERLDVIINSVTTAIELLHAVELVFGDLRTPNILVGEDGHVKLIDFDWCGVHGKHRYPFIVGNGIEWAKGVGPLAIMYKQHDLFMLERLKEHIQAGDDPGVW